MKVTFLRAFNILIKLRINSCEYFSTRQPSFHVREQGVSASCSQDGKAVVVAAAACSRNSQICLVVLYNPGLHDLDELNY